VAVALELTSARESIRMMTIGAWRKAGAPVLGKNPAIFLLLA
jgi:hypothetical protein